MSRPQPSTPERERAGEAPEPGARWRQLAIVAVALLLGMAPWFSSAAVAPALREAWGPGGLAGPLLTVAVQLGFAFGALGLAVVGAVDVVPAHRLLATGAVLAALANLGFAFLAVDWASALPFRLVTGLAIAAVYPVSLKVIAGWFRRDRGLAIGVLIGALTIGSGLPFLLRGIGLSAGSAWQVVVAGTSVAAIAGAVLALVAVRPGPWDVPAPRFSPAIAAEAFRSPSVRLANLGYLGHMWELYAMWTWVPAFLAASLAAAGATDPTGAALIAFLVIASGGAGCVAAGVLADRLGRTTVTSWAMGVSGGSALVIGWWFGGPPVVVVALAVVWGVSVVADSAQFSAAASELSPPGTAGSALAVQTASGFVLTGITILGVGLLDPTDGPGWRLAFSALAIGPFIGILAMARLRRRPDASRMAHGRR